MRALAPVPLAALLVLSACAAAPLPAPSRAPAPTKGAPTEGAALDSGALEPAPEASELAAMEQHLFDLRAVRGSTAVRAPVSLEEFHPEELPVITVPEPLTPLNAPVAVTGFDTHELLFDGKRESPLGTAKQRDDGVSLHLGVRDRTVGRIRVGYSEADLAVGASVNCGGPGAKLRAAIPLRWETVAPTDKGGVEYEVVNAWFDTAACTAVVVERASVLAVPILGRVLYAFRLRAPSGDRPDALALVSPRLHHQVSAAFGGETTIQLGPFSRITLPLRRGAGASMIGRIAAPILQRWETSLGPSGFPSGELQLGVELVQGVDDPAPIAVAYVGLPRSPDAIKANLPPDPPVLNPLDAR